ncbi:B12-binding domain-containing radical SAM protein [Halobacteriota archaeon]
MKIALVNVLDVPEVPPMGLAYIATYLREYGSFENTKIIDANVENVWDGIKIYKPDVIAISSMTITYSTAIELAKRIKQEQDVPCIIGGPHISTLPSSLSKDFDMGVIGEGEQTILELIQLYDKDKEFRKEKLKDIGGLAYHNNGKVSLTKKRDLIQPLDKIPIPDRKFLDPSYFNEKRVFFTDRIGREAHMLTLRGCPYRCIFCSTSALWQNVTRYHSVEHICSEVNELIDKYKVNAIQIWDDTFTINKKRLQEISEAFKKEKINEKVEFSCQPRANLVDDNLCEILKNIGVTTVSFGFESGSDKVLNYLKAGSVTVEQNKTAIKTCKKHGLNVFGSLMFGSPGETLEDIRQTLDLIDFMGDNYVDLIWAFISTPFPSTEFWEVAKSRGKVNDEEMDWNTLSHSYAKNPFLLDDSVDRAEFKRLFEEAKQRIYVSFERKYWHHSLGWMLKQGIVNPKRGFEVLLKILKLKTSY